MYARKVICRDRDLSNFNRNWSNFKKEFELRSKAAGNSNLHTAQFNFKFNFSSPVKKKYETVNIKLE